MSVKIFLAGRIPGTYLTHCILLPSPNEPTAEGVGFADVHSGLLSCCPCKGVSILCLVEWECARALHYCSTVMVSGLLCVGRCGAEEAPLGPL